MLDCTEAFWSTGQISRLRMHYEAVMSQMLFKEGKEHIVRFEILVKKPERTSMTLLVYV